HRPGGLHREEPPRPEDAARLVAILQARELLRGPGRPDEGGPAGPDRRGMRRPDPGQSAEGRAAGPDGEGEPGPRRGSLRPYRPAGASRREPRAAPLAAPPRRLPACPEVGEASAAAVIDPALALEPTRHTATPEPQ